MIFGGLPGWLPADLAAVVSAGGACLRCRLPALPLALFPAPIPPPPFPTGRGRFLLFICKGLRPLHPRGWAGSGIGFSCGKRVPLVITAVQGDSKPCRLGRGTGEQCRQPRRGGTGGEELRRLRWSSPPGQRQASAAGGTPPAGDSSGRSNQCRRGHISRRGQLRQVEPVPPGARPASLPDFYPNRAFVFGSALDKQEILR